MKIHTWIRANKLTLAEAASRIGISAPHLYKIVYLNSLPGRDTMKKIYHATMEAVRGDDVYELVPDTYSEKITD